MTISKREIISGFRGNYWFLSNFFRRPIVFEGLFFPSSEHAYQAMKAKDDSELFEKIRLAENPGASKRLGHKVVLPENWERIKLDLMERIVRAKFSQHRDLRFALIETADAELREENNWGDTFWGCVNGKGSNHLGKILMEIRKELRESVFFNE